MAAVGRIRIGDMLVQAGFVTDAQVEQALSRQKESGRRLGEELVDLGFVTEMQLTQILSNQLSIPWVSLYHVQFARDLLNLVPSEVASEYCLIPVYVRKVRREGETLFVAMDDPTNDDALRKVRELAGLPVKPMVAPPSEVRDAIRVYYFGGRRSKGPPSQRAPASGPASSSHRAPPPNSAPPPPLGRSSGVPAAGVRSKPPPTPPEARSTAPAPEQPAPEEAVPASSEAARPARASGAMKRAAAKRQQRMITLTLLDGTEVRLPANKDEKGTAEPAENLTAHDLVSALLARGEGQDVSDILPPDKARWEIFFATMLNVLLRKGLIADWEFVDEWHRHVDKDKDG